MAARRTFKEVTDNVRGLASLIEQRSKSISSRLEPLGREGEALKVDVFVQELEEARAMLARSRGAQGLMKGQDALTVLGNALFDAIAGALESRSGYGLLRGSLQGFGRGLQASGERDVEWVVELGGDKIGVVPLFRGNAPPPGRWVSWQELGKAALHLKERALEGERLGDIAGFLAKLGQETAVLQSDQAN